MVLKELCALRVQLDRMEKKLRALEEQDDAPLK